MDKEEAIKKLQSISGHRSDKWKDRVANREARKDFLEMSKTTAINILSTLRVKGMTQKDLAILLEVTPQTVNQWVKGTENFKFDTVGRIARVLGVPPMTLITPLPSRSEYFQSQYQLTHLDMPEEYQDVISEQEAKVVAMYPTVPREFQSEAL